MTPAANVVPSLDGIYEIAVKEQCDFLPQGILCPVMDDRGVIVHTTGTKRLSWDVYWDGLVMLRVDRPHGPCLEASIAPEGQILRMAMTGFPVYARHVLAMAGAMAALADESCEHPALCGRCHGGGRSWDDQAQALIQCPACDGTGKKK